MSIYADNWILDEETGEAKLVKHLNQVRIDRCTLSSPPGGWNRSGKKHRISKRWNKENFSKSWRKKIILERISNPELDLPISYKKGNGNVEGSNIK